MDQVPTYKGVPLPDLRIDEVIWSEEGAEHIRTRELRKGPGEVNIEPEWATQAALDPLRVIAVAGSTNPDTASLKIIGTTGSAAAPILLKVWVWSDEPATSSRWFGGSASPANPTDIRRYTERTT